MYCGKSITLSITIVNWKQSLHHRSYWIGSSVWRQHKTFLHPCFMPLTFQHCFLALALVPLLDKSSDNPSIMFSKLFHREQKLFCSFDVLPYEKSLHMFAKAVGQTWLVSGRCLSITNITCTGMWFMVNWLWFTKSVISPLHLSSYL